MSLSELVQSLRNEVLGIKTRLFSLLPTANVYAATGDYVQFGCKVTEGADAADMVVALEGAATGDEDNHNPHVAAVPTRYAEYPNIAVTMDGGFYSLDTVATVEDAPATGLGRYDIAYIYLGQAGAGFAIATGTPGTDVKTDFDSNGLDTALYSEATITDPVLPTGAIPVARIYVEDDVVGIPNARIADIRELDSDIGASNAAIAQEAADYVASMESAINTVNANEANIDTVAGISASVTTVAGISGNVTTVAGIAVDVTTVAGIAADVTTVAGLGPEMTSVLAIQADIETVAGIAANVTTVAGVSADVQTVAANITDIQNAEENATAAEEWANNAEDVLVSAASGGDQVDDYSARHWAAKAEFWAGEAASATLASMDDVTITSIANLDLLQYDSGSGQWVNRTLAAAGVSAIGHTHTAANVTDFSTAVQAVVTQAYINGLNVDAETLDGLDSTAFARISNVQRFTASGTWTPPAGATQFAWIAVGGGGGGGGGSNSSFGGGVGSAGGHSVVAWNGKSVSTQGGLGGAGGSSGGSPTGGAGGSTSGSANTAFDGICLLAGGSTGSGGSAATGKTGGASGGAATGASGGATGAVGSAGKSGSGGGGGGGASGSDCGGAGGGGGSASHGTGVISGNVTITIGAGGGGGNGGGGSSSLAGGAGGSGVVLIWAIQ